jgi:hypothetical protein
MKSLRRLAIVAVLAVLTVAFTSRDATAASILLYDHNSTNDNAQDALATLGLSYTLAGAANFDTLLAGSTWDLVILDIPSVLPASGFAGLISYIAGGGSALMSFWQLQSEAALAAAFQVSVATTIDPPQDVFAWDAGHPIFTGVGTLNSWTDIWADDGDRLNSAGATLLGGFSAAPAAGMGAIALGNGGRTLYNGFLWDEMTSASGQRLLENEIQFLLAPTAVPEPGTWLLLGSGLAAIVGLRRRNKA